MDPRRILTLADELTKKKGPAEFRSAISRAYYAVYNVADQFLARMGIAQGKGNYHVILQRRLLNSGDVEFAKIGSELGDFHSRRNKADYKMNDLASESEQKALAAIQEAKRMIDAFDACPIYGTRWKQIQAAINKAGV